MEPFEVWILRTMMMMGDDDDSDSDNSKNYCFCEYLLLGRHFASYLFPKLQFLHVQSEENSI